MRVADTNIDLPPVLKQEGPAKIRRKTIVGAGLLLVSEVSTTATSDRPQILDSRETPFVTTPIKRVRPPRVVMQKLLLKTLRRRSAGVEWVPPTDSDLAALQTFSPLSKNGAPKTTNPRIISSRTIGTRTEDSVPKLHLERVLAGKMILETEKPRGEIVEPKENNADLLEAPEEQPETQSLVDGSAIGVDRLSLTQLSKKLLVAELTIGIEDLSLTQLVGKQFGDESIFESLSLAQPPEKLLEGELIGIEDLSLTQVAGNQFGDESIFKVAEIPKKLLGKPTIEIDIGNPPLLELSQKTLGDGLVAWVDNLSPMDKTTEEGEVIDIQQHPHSQNYASFNTALQTTPQVLHYPVSTSCQSARHFECPTTARRNSTKPVHLNRIINRKIKTKLQPKITNLRNVQHCLTDKVSTNIHQAPALRMEVLEGGEAMELTFSENSTVRTTGGNSLGSGVGCQSQPGEEQGMVEVTNDSMDGVEVSVGSGVVYAIGHGGGGKYMFGDGKSAISRPEHCFSLANVLSSLTLDGPSTASGQNLRRFATASVSRRISVPVRVSWTDWGAGSPSNSTDILPVTPKVYYHLIQQ